jgi:hypothetical protein
VTTHTKVAPPPLMLCVDEVAEANPNVTLSRHLPRNNAMPWNFVVLRLVAVFATFVV